MSMTHDVRADYTRFTVKALSPTIGAELHGIDLREPVDDETISQIRGALLQFKVVFFRDQDINVEQHIAFGRRFGELEIHPATPMDQPHREVLRLVHGPDARGAENAWHSDVTWRPAPSLGSILRAVQVPPVGGDTLFCDMAAVYEGLSDDLKVYLSGLTAVHDIMRSYRSRVPVAMHAELSKKNPPQEHPVIRTHPETGCNLLYVNIAFTEYMKGLAKSDSDALLHYLWNQTDVPEYQVRFRWEEGSIAFWDNRACQHYAVSDYYPQVRIMERITIAGDRPYFAPGAKPTPMAQFGMNYKAPLGLPDVRSLSPAVRP